MCSIVKWFKKFFGCECECKTDDQKADDQSQTGVDQSTVKVDKNE